MIVGIEESTNYMQRSHDAVFGFWLQFYRESNPCMRLAGIAELMGIRYDEQFRDNVRRLKQ